MATSNKKAKIITITTSNQLVGIYQRKQQIKRIELAVLIANNELHHFSS